MVEKEGVLEAKVFDKKGLIGNINNLTKALDAEHCSCQCACDCVCMCDYNYKKANIYTQEAYQE